jgi:phosphopantothenoylcysteine decarboxylase/phosphopantothenate--cysteine ligase
MLSFTNKRILLGVTGGIAAYKCAELTRLLIKAGAEVRVGMTRAATEFITPLTMQALSGQRVHLDLLDSDAEAAMGHIELARWADLVLIAPATADFIARIAQGQANDILSTMVLATSAKVAIAPAMNQAMWANDSTMTNLNVLVDRGYHIFGPAEGEQACGDVGPGRMMEPAQLLELSASLFETGELAGKNFVITGGPTREAIDPVRFISNHSSGKMAYALAAEAVAAGAKVILISGPVNLPNPKSVKRINVISAAQMLGATHEAMTNCDVFIGVAAVADYRPVEIERQKIKKSDEQMQLTLVKNPDIISEIAQLKEKPFVVGFAAETNDIISNGRDKLKRKNLDMLFANNATETFNSDSIFVTALTETSETELKAGNKNVVARNMLQLIATALNEQ